MRTIELPDGKAQITDIWIKVQGQCGHVWEYRATGGIDEDWFVCRKCLTPQYDYKYTKVLVKYPYLNRGG